MRIQVTSRLEARYLGPLQDLLFFNRNQSRFRDAIVSSIQEFGEPRVESDGESLRVHTTRLGEVQALYALEVRPDGDSRPVGAAIYARTAEDTMTLLHIGVAEDYASDGPHAGSMLTLNLFSRLVAIGKQIKGIKKVVVLYGPEIRNEIPVRR